MRFSPHVFFLFFAAIFLSCNGNKTALIWTDHPEFAFYGEYFNASQDQYKVEIRYINSPATELINTNTIPDIVIGSWLKNAYTITHFRSLDNYFGENKIPTGIFYQQLLAKGRIDRRQYLLPVSFNAPAIIFSKNKNEGLSNPFTIGFEELKKISMDYNTANNGAFTQMGFSPLWDSSFLFIIATLFNASFREAAPLAWDTEALDRSMRYVYDWAYEVNTNIQAVEDFTFKYFFEPPAKLAQSGRILFSYMESSDYFILKEDIRGSLNFRWLAEGNRIPLIEGSVFLGLPKKGKSPMAAAAFVRWFFRIETQNRLLENARTSRVNETVFGICGGFSSLRPVTEQIFPRFYPDLLGHMPPAEFLLPADVFPGNWTVLKERIILPYLHDRARSEHASDVYPLEKRIADWMRVNR